MGGVLSLTAGKLVPLYFEWL